MTTTPNSKDSLPFGLPQGDPSTSKLEEARQKLLKRILSINKDAQNEDNPEKSANKDIEEVKLDDKTMARKIENGYQLTEYIDNVYQCDYETRQQIIDQVSFKKIRDFLLSEEFLIEAARKLSYKCLVFIIEGPVAKHFFRSNFAQGSKILELFIEGLKAPEIEEERKQKILRTLLWINEKEVEDAVITTADSKLIKTMISAKLEIHEVDEYSEFLESKFDFSGE